MTVVSLVASAKARSNEEAKCLCCLERRADRLDACRAGNGASGQAAVCTTSSKRNVYRASSSRAGGFAPDRPLSIPVNDPLALSQAYWSGKKKSKRKYGRGKVSAPSSPLHTMSCRVMSCPKKGSGGLVRADAAWPQGCAWVVGRASPALAALLLVGRPGPIAGKRKRCSVR